MENFNFKKKDNELANSPANSIKPVDNKNQQVKATLVASSNTNNDQVVKSKTVEGVKDLATVVTEGTVESCLDVTRGAHTLTILSHEFLFRMDYSEEEGNRYRLMGIGGSMLVNEQELDHIYSEFKKFNK